MDTMTSQTILENKYLTLWYHPDTKIVHHKFHRFVYGDRFREGLTAGVSLLKKHSCRKWLSDDRKNAALSPEDVDWCMAEFFPQAIKAGWKYWAIIMPEKVIGQLNMKRFIKTYSEMGLTVKVFVTPDKAMTWLESLK